MGSPFSAAPTAAAAGRPPRRTLAASTQLGIADPQLASAAAEWEQAAAAAADVAVPALALANKPARPPVVPAEHAPPPPPPPTPQAAWHTPPAPRDHPLPAATPGSTVVLAGRRFDSLLHLRYEMRALQRRLLGEGEEVAVPPDSPHFKLIQVCVCVCGDAFGQGCMCCRAHC